MIEDRDGRGLEWFEILTHIYTEPVPFDFNARYDDPRGVSDRPRPVQQPWRATLNAGLFGPVSTGPRSDMVAPSTLSPWTALRQDHAAVTPGLAGAAHTVAANSGF